MKIAETKLYLIRGLPASGKSTKAKEICKETGAVRVNRDLLREMLHFSEYSPKNESLIVKTEIDIAKKVLSGGTSVVVDDCNLNEENLKRWGMVGGLHELVIIDMETPVEVCLERDRSREKRVGDHVILNMALEYGLVKIDREVVICDIDGTVANLEHRLHHIKKEPKDWASFFAEISNDTPIESTINKIREEQSAGRQVIFVSGRPDSCRAETAEWLKKHLPDIDSRFLLMRKAHDKREDTIVKSEIFFKYLDGLDIKMVYDDRPSVIRMWRDLNLPVTDVGFGIEF